MDDLISRQAVIEAIERDAYRHTYLDQILDIIKSMPSVQPEIRYYGQFEIKDPILISEQRWIPCSERLPAEGASVFLCDRYGDMTLGQLVRTDEGFKWDVFEWWNDIDDWDAWQPLPEPYKGEQE